MMGLSRLLKVELLERSILSAMKASSPPPSLSMPSNNGYFIYKHTGLQIIQITGLHDVNSN
jgi:hypothetical protein